MGERIAADALNAVMEFDHVIRVCEDGTIAAEREVFAPECCMTNDGGVYVTPTWELLSGYTGQYGYRGPVMHASEFIGGRIAADILAGPGVYVAVVVEADTCDEFALYGECENDCSDEPAGWAIARLKNCAVDSDNHSADRIAVYRGTVEPTIVCGYHNSRGIYS